MWILFLVREGLYSSVWVWLHFPLKLTLHWHNLETFIAGKPSWDIWVQLWIKMLIYSLISEELWPLKENSHTYSLVWYWPLVVTAINTCSSFITTVKSGLYWWLFIRWYKLYIISLFITHVYIQSVNLLYITFFSHCLNVLLETKGLVFLCVLKSVHQNHIMVFL